MLIADDPPLLAALEALARDARLVFFAGLPGTGKSLLIHQLAHLAHARGECQGVQGRSGPATMRAASRRTPGAGEHRRA